MDITSLPVIPTSATAMVGLIVVLILFGRIVPKSAVEEVKAERDKRVAEVKEDRDLWKAAYETEVTRNAELTSQVGTLLEVGRTADHVIRALPAAAEANGSSDAVSTS